MAPTVGIKRSPASMQTVAAPPPCPPDARFAVREAVKSTLADPAPGARLDAPAPVLEGFLCLEEIEGRRWKYIIDAASGNNRRKGRCGSAVPLGASVRVVPLKSPLPPAKDEHPVSLGKTSVWNQHFQESETVEQINRDVKRTHPDMQFFNAGSSDALANQESPKRILTIFAKF